MADNGNSPNLKSMKSKSHKRFRRFHVRKFMESEGYQEIRRGEKRGPIFVKKLGEGRGRLFSARDRR